MIHTYSLGRAARYFPERTAFASDGARATFRELHQRVASIATALSRHGLGAGDRLAILLPNSPEYICGRDSGLTRSARFADDERFASGGDLRARVLRHRQVKEDQMLPVWNVAVLVGSLRKASLNPKTALALAGPAPSATDRAYQNGAAAVDLLTESDTGIDAPLDRRALTAS